MRLGGSPAVSERVSIVRHLAIGAAALAAYILRDELGVGNAVLWILGGAALVNMALFLLAKRPGTRLIARPLSPALGVAGWAALVHQTGGAASPFTAGLGLEIILAAMSFSQAAVAWVTAAATAALWIVHASTDAAGLSVPLALQSALLLVMGTVAFALTRRSNQAQRSLTLQRDAIRTRLRDLENELEQVRVVGRVGENAARVAHTLKNAVHSLRGFVQLIEERTEGRRNSQEALRGLRAAIDDLESLARQTLRGGRDEATGASCDEKQFVGVLDDVTRELSAGHPGIRWVKRFDELAVRLAISPGAFREVLLILLRNAVEAMDGPGEIEVEARATDEGYAVRVRDHGCGLPGESPERIFEPGFTTKPAGSGFGLFLARRLLEARGGRLDIQPALGGGAVFRVLLLEEGR